MMNENRLTDAKILAQIPAARARARARDRSEPRAAAASFDRGSGVVRIDLTNGCAFEFPSDLAPELRGASPEELERVEVYPHGVGLRWDELDVDLSVPHLVAGLFGGGAWARELGRVMGEKGGRARTAAKAAAARENGRKGGRPRKSASPRSR